MYLVDCDGNHDIGDDGLCRFVGHNSFLRIRIDLSIFFNSIQHTSSGQNNKYRCRLKKEKEQY
jgi:hypothetical protein